MTSLTLFDECEPTATRLPLLPLLAEPQQTGLGQAGKWGLAAFRRIEAVSRAPVATIPPHSGLLYSYSSRLETARIPITPPGVDVGPVRAAAYPAHQGLLGWDWGWGSRAPRLVLIGNRAPDPSVKPGCSQPGVWLLRALRLLGHDELSIYWMNSSGEQDRVKRVLELFEQYEPQVLGLGVDVCKRLEKWAIPHTPAKSPSYYFQWKMKEGPDGYADDLHRAGLAVGPWGEPSDPASALPLGKDPGPMLPYFPPPFHVHDFQYRRATEKKDQIGLGSATNPVAKEEARAKFVTGQGDYTAVAKETGIHRNTIMALAKKEGWKEQRVEHAKAKADATLQADIEAETRNAVKARDSAFKALDLGLADLVTRLMDGSLHPTPQAVKSIADIAMVLKGSRIGEANEEMDRLLSMSQDELKQELLNNQAGQFAPQEKTLGPEPTTESADVSTPDHPL